MFSNSRVHQLPLPLAVTLRSTMSQPRTDPAKRGLLSERETFWRDRYDWLKEHGYELRPRFRPGWTPSWQGTKRTIISCEDGMRLMVCSWLLAHFCC